MGLEHRWSTRKRVCLDAIVFHRPLGLLPAKILDIDGQKVTVREMDLLTPGISPAASCCRFRGSSN